MLFKGKSIKKYEYILDTFKATCELNNYELVNTSLLDESQTVRNSQIEEILKSIDRKKYEKMYFFGTVLRDREEFELGAIVTGKSDIYVDGELINMAVKFLYNLGALDVKVRLNNNDRDLADNLEMLDIDITHDSDLKLDKNDLVFEVFMDNDKIISGYSNRSKKESGFTIDYELLEEYDDYILRESTLDALIIPESEDVFGDAFVIASNLKDAGFKVDVDYIKGEDHPIDALYLIKFGEKDISEYRVKMIDSRTMEESDVSIDSIMEVLAFM